MIIAAKKFSWIARTSLAMTGVWAWGVLATHFEYSSW